MKLRNICVAVIFAILALMCLVGCQSEAPAESAPPSFGPVITANPAAEPVGSTEAGNDIYEVSNIDEFLSVIGPARIIFLAPGNYELSSAQGYGSTSGEYHTWIETYDGYELVISALEDLRIVGGAEYTAISTAPRYSNVLRFEGCSRVSVEDLTLGHSEEPGSCSGGVLYYENCSEIYVKNCHLYGCGTIGITAFNCKRLYADKCSIYDCSDNAVFAGSCHDLRISDSSIHNNGGEWADALFYADGCSGFALVNCQIYDNSCRSMIFSNFSQQLSILGCEARDNIFETVFDCRGYSPVLDKSSIALDAPETYGALPCVDTEGKELSGMDIANMRLGTAAYEGPKKAQPVELNETINEDGLREVSVRTVDEFLAAIGPNTVIKLSEGSFDLSRAADYGAYGSDYYYWSNSYDGPCLVINGVSNLSIIGSQSSIIAQPRYADVLRFLNCENISLSGITAGHSPEEGTCSGGVLAFENCWDISIDKCNLYGCGIRGIQAYYSSDLKVSNTEIYECSMGAIALFTVMDASFENMNIHDCAKPEISLHDCMGITYEGENLKYGDYEIMPDGSLMSRS